MTVILAAFSEVPPVHALALAAIKLAAPSIAIDPVALDVMDVPSIGCHADAGSRARNMHFDHDTPHPEALNVSGA